MIEYPSTERLGAIEDELDAQARRVRLADPSLARELCMLAVRAFAVNLDVVQLEISARPVRHRETRMRPISNALEPIWRVTTTGRNGS